MEPFANLFMDIVRYDPHLRRTNHLLKVTSYGVMIAREEKVPADKALIIQAACLLHDIGIKPSKEKYGSADGKYQQIEGPPLAERLLEKYGHSRPFVERVSYLIAHHHDYDNVDDIDYRILVEVDFLVNCDEGGMDRDAIRRVREAHFRTHTGIRLLTSLFGLEEGGA